MFTNNREMNLIFYTQLIQ